MKEGSRYILREKERASIREIKNHKINRRSANPYNNIDKSKEYIQNRK